MAKTVTATMVAAALEAAIPRLACQLPHDVFGGLRAAHSVESHPRATATLDHLIANAIVASRDSVPICQDTGTVWVSLEIGPDVSVAGDVFAGVDGAVARAYDSARLRKSLVRDALSDRSNTQDNTPAFTDLHLVDEPGVARIHVMLKGGGSDNASRVVMLTPGAGREAIVEEVVKCVREKGANACPPLVIGVGVGSTFDKVAGLAKRALMRPVGQRNADEAAAELERDLFVAVNSAGVGPGGLGGAMAALDVKVETAPCHIAALPLAINMGCSALRRATIDLTSLKDTASQLDVQLVKLASDEAAALDVSAVLAGAQGATPKHIDLPARKEELACLRAGDTCLLSGTMYTLRDAGHARLLGELADAGESLPYGLDGQTIFYAGPTPATGTRPFGAVGPTTASRMDFAASELYDAGIVATIGKGRRNAQVHEACKRNASVYFTATGGAAALLATCVESSEVVAYDDLGTEALRRVEVKDFPVFVGIDSTGADVYDLG